MLRNFTYIMIAVLAASISCSREKIVARVNGEKISASRLLAEMEMERGKYDSAILSQEVNFNEFRKQALGKLIEEAILLGEAKKLGIKLEPAEIKEIEKARKEAFAVAGEASPERGDIAPDAWEAAQRQRRLIKKLVQQAVIDSIPVSDEKVSLYYRQHIQEFNQSSQFHARQILVDTREVADDIYSKLKSGEDFAELARKFSTSPDGKRGGDLGFFDSSAYPPIFSEICQQLGPGEISAVIPTDYGYQIFQLIEKRPPRQIPFEEARIKIAQKFKEEQSEKAFETWILSLKEKAKVSIDETVLKGVVFEKTN